jgi:hypothetical protein
MSPDKYFELFASDQILKEYDLSAEEVQAGIVDGGGDGGIDAVYIFVNGQLVAEDSDLSEVKRNAVLKLVCIQAKNQTGFSEDAVNALRSSSEQLLDLATPVESLVTIYNGSLLKIVRRFRDVYSQLALKFPRIEIEYFYASKGDEPHPNVVRKVQPLEESIKGLFSDVNFTFSFLTNRMLVSLARIRPDAVRSLVAMQQPMQSKEAFICLVKLGDFYKFITDNRKLARHIFDSNVRDHQGKTEVNSEIQKTLQDLTTTEEFWWLNNGITILSESARYDGNALLIKNPQIVNGVQTSTEIYNYFSQSKTFDTDIRTILVRILDPKDAASQDRIIKATNSQNSVAPATLRSTEKVHRDIEQYFRTSGYYYDRRKNYYKNEGKPFNKIIPIPYLAQSIMSAVLRRPGDARARPSSLLKSDDQYKRIFNEQHPLDLYLFAALLMRRVDEYLYTADKLDRKDATNVRFYVAMLAVMELTSMPQPKVARIASLSVSDLTDEILRKLLDEVLEAYLGLGGSDQVAKGPELTRQLVDVRTKAYILKRSHVTVSRKLRIR